MLLRHLFRSDMASGDMVSGLSCRHVLMVGADVVVGGGHFVSRLSIRHVFVVAVRSGVDESAANLFFVDELSVSGRVARQGEVDRASVVEAGYVVRVVMAGLDFVRGSAVGGVEVDELSASGGGGSGDGSGDGRRSSSAVR